MRGVILGSAVAVVLACVAGRAEAGAVKGVVLDGDGRPMPDVRITVEHTVFHARYVFGKSGADGRYRVEVPDGGWTVHAQITREYHGRSYFFDLAPDDPAPFAGGAGAVRNFTWRIAGPRPEPSGGRYGGQLTLYRAIGDFSFELEDLEVTLTPDGPLIDGHEVRPITAHPAAGRDQIDDVPIGRHTVRVSHPSQGPLLVRVRNHGEPAAQATVLFAAPFPGSSRYGLELEVKAR